MNTFDAMQPQAREAWALFVILCRLGFDPRQIAMGLHGNGQVIVSLVGGEDKLYTAFLGPPLVSFGTLLGQWKEGCQAVYEKSTRPALVTEVLERTEAYKQVHSIIENLAAEGMLDLKDLVIDRVDLREIELPENFEPIDPSKIEVEIEDESIQRSAEGGNGDDTGLLGRKN